MSLFKQLEGDVAIVQSGGVFKQVDVYTRNGFLFVNVAGGYVRLKADGSTSKSNMSLVHIETEAALYKDKLNRLGTKRMPGSTKLETSQTERLMLEA